MVEYDARNNKMMGKNMESMKGGHDFFPKEAKSQELKACGAIRKHFDYPDTQQAIYEDQEDQIKDASMDYAKEDRRR